MSNSLDDELKHLMKISDDVDQKIEKFSDQYKPFDAQDVENTLSSGDGCVEKTCDMNQSMQSLNYVKKKMYDSTTSEDNEVDNRYEREEYKEEPSNQDKSANNKEPLGLAKENIGPKATIRFYKAQIQTLTKRLEAMTEDKIALEKQSRKLKSQANEEIKQRNVAQKALDKANSKNEENAQEIKALKGAVEDLRVDIASLQKENAASQKLLKAVDRDKNVRNMKLSRALEECEKHKQMLSKATEETKKFGSKSNECIEELAKKARTLERQRNDLVQAYRKQMKLIELLKRQKVHLELAKQLDIREADFLQVIDWNNDETLNKPQI